MEVDVQSPRRLIMRSISNKRSRSPDSEPRSSERASKRTFLVSPHDCTITPQNAHQFPQFVCHSSVGGGPSLREDEWLDQARGLRIHSPALECLPKDAGASSSTVSLPEFPAMREDFSMRFEKHDEMPMESSDAQSAHLLHLNDFDMEMSGLQPPDSLGASPHSPLSSISDTDDAPERMEAMPTSHSPERLVEASSHSAGAVKRKPVLTMGPRADCEKCRARVPGHWMHRD